MKESHKLTPVVLSIAGHDPTGGAGIQADIESILANHCRPVSVITCLTAQNRHGLKNLVPQRAEDFQLQLQLLTRETKIQAVKIGVIGDEEILWKICHWLDQNPNLTVILDPVLKTSTNDDLVNEALISLMKKELIPRATIITPNSLEAKALSQIHDSLNHAANVLHELGCKHILITGTHEKETKVKNTHYRTEHTSVFTYERLEGEFHGSGCTLSSALASQLALGKSVDDAVKQALDYTWQCLFHSKVDTTGYAITKRIFESKH